MIYKTTSSRLSNHRISAMDNSWFVFVFNKSKN
nr:MAG TPA: hypothetical protein [Caudoviricetes sp.]